jgi:hypothetical protein
MNGAKQREWGQASVPVNEVQRTVTILVTDWQQDAASTLTSLQPFYRLRHWAPADKRKISI